MSRAWLLGLTALAAFGGARAQDAVPTGVPPLPTMAAVTLPALISTMPPAPQATMAPVAAAATEAPTQPPPAVTTAAPAAAATEAPTQPPPAATPAALVTDALPPTNTTEAGTPLFDVKASAAEFVAMLLFVIIGCGSAMGIAKEPGSAWVLHVSLAFGLAITALAYSLGRFSGGQINCAVTLTLFALGKLTWAQALGNFVAQMLGSVAGALVLLGIFPRKEDRTGALGSNAVGANFTQIQAMLAELFMTFVLCTVVVQSGYIDSYASGIAVICIGFAVFIAHLVLIPIDGCSINPTRSFGPALVAAMCVKGTTVESSDEENEVSEEGQSRAVKSEINTFKDMWVFWVGPLLGSLFAAGVNMLFLM